MAAKLFLRMVVEGEELYLTFAENGKVARYKVDSSPEKTSVCIVAKSFEGRKKLSNAFNILYNTRWNMKELLGLCMDHEMGWEVIKACVEISKKDLTLDLVCDRM